jgi:hypothetical protein
MTVIIKKGERVRDKKLLIDRKDIPVNKER